MVPELENKSKEVAELLINVNENKIIADAQATKIKGEEDEV